MVVSDLGAFDVALRGHAEPSPGVRLGRPAARRQVGLLRRGRQRRSRQSQQRRGFPCSIDGEIILEKHEGLWMSISAEMHKLS